MEKDKPLFNKLTENPQYLLVLFRISIDPDKINLPAFIDYGNICKTKLEILGLVDSNAKHIHGKVYTLTSNGKKFINEFKNELHTLFDNIPLNDRLKFEQYYYSQLKKIDSANFESDLWPEIITTFNLPELEQYQTRNGVKFKLTCEKISKEDYNITGSVSLECTCLKCQQVFSKKITIEFNLESFKIIPNQIRFQCPKCGVSYETDAYFSRITHKQ